MSDNRFDFLEIGDSKPRVVTPEVAPPPPDYPRIGEAPAPPAEQREIRMESGPRWEVVEVIGGPGREAGQFASPRGLAVDRAGNLYVADSYNHRVQRISPQGDVAPLGSRGSRQGQLLNPQGVAVDSEGRLFVAEQGNNRIQVFSPEGEFLGAFGTLGVGLAQFQGPAGLALGPCGSLFVADPGNRRFTKWARYGEPLGIGGLTRSGGTLMDSPQGLTVDRTGRVYVTDRFRHVVYVYTADLVLEATLGGIGITPGKLSQPQDIALDESGRMYVAEAGNNRLQIFDDKGACLAQVTSAPGHGDLETPSGVAVAPDGSVYLADTGNHRIVRLQRTGTDEGEE